MNDWPTQLADFPAKKESSLFDRRRYVRTAPIAEGTHLWVDSDLKWPVEVVDRSETGVGLLLPESVSFTFAPIVYVDYEGRRRSATVAHITRVSDGYRIGLEWCS